MRRAREFPLVRASDIGSPPSLPSLTPLSVPGRAAQCQLARTSAAGVGHVGAMRGVPLAIRHVACYFSVLVAAEFPIPGHATHPWHRT